VRGQILYWFIAWVPVIGGMGWIVDEWCRQKYCCELDGEKREELEFILIRSILIITVFVFSLFNFFVTVWDLVLGRGIRLKRIISFTL